MADGGSVIFKFEGDDKPLQKAMASATNTLGGIGKTALKTAGVVTAALGTAFVGLVSASVKARGEIEQQIGGTEAVFGQYANEIQEMAKKSFETMGTSANDYMATINKMGALMKGSGIDTKTAMDLSSQAMQRAADVASVMGISMEDAMNSIAGAAKGNFTMMDNLGVAMNATTIENYALEKGLNKTYNTMTNAEKIQLAMEMFLEKTAYAAGNYTKENETLAGSISTLKAAWGNFLSGAGDLSQVVSAVTNTGKIIIKSVVEIIPELIKQLSQAIPQVIEIVQQLMPQIIKSFTDVMPKIAEMGQNLFMKFIEGISQNIPKLMETVNQMIMTFTNWIIQNLPKIIESGIKIIVSLVNGIAQMLPTLIPQAVNAIITIVEGLLDNIDQIIEAGVNLIVGLAEGLILAIPILIEKAPEIIEKLFSAIVRSLPKIAQAGGQIIGKLVMGIIGSIIKIVETAPKLIAALVNGIRSGFHAMVDVGVNLVKGLWQRNYINV